MRLTGGAAPSTFVKPPEATAESQPLESLMAVRRHLPGSLEAVRVLRGRKGHRVGGCQLNTLVKIGGALGVRAKKLYDEGDKLI